VRFFVGLHHPSAAQHFERCMVSANRLRERRSDFTVREWIMDSGAFTEISRHGDYRHEPEEYAEQVERWSRCGQMLAAVSQDYMCEPFVLAGTGRTVEEHQHLTIERYRALQKLSRQTYVMPVLQGWLPADYAKHVHQYGSLLRERAWVGVGSVCKRNSKPSEVEAVLLAIYQERPDLRLHGFGLKLTALASGLVRGLLWSTDSMAWSFAARMNGGDANDWREAMRYAGRVESQPVQLSLLEERA
jgi:hypothetical protein